MRNLDLLKILGRDALRIPEADDFSGKRIVITGAGGSIGSAIARRLVGQVSFLGLIGHSEAPIFKLRNELGLGPDRQYAVRDAGYKPEQWLCAWQPDTVIHCAAHKHVGLMEDSPQSAFQNNTENTIRIAREAQKWGVKRFVFISTDKAVQPTSVMGASKRLAEAWLLTHQPRFASICRFGNVIGSSDSLVQIIEATLRERRPLTLTSEGMKRYFITPEEAANLALAAACRPGMVTLDMGSAIPIRTIMERMMEQMGVSVPIVVTSPGSGEKEDENLFNPEETLWTAAWTHATDLLRVQSELQIEAVDLALHHVRTGTQTLVEAANSL